jgi:TRAP-type C4-dicarboxylate transport system substrate-binding protein
VARTRREFLISAASTAAASAALSFSAGSARAQETSLLFGTTNAPQIPVNTQIMHPWAKRINDQGKGAVVIDVRDGPTLANFNNYYDRVISDTVQISWGIQSYIAGKFVGSLVAGLPFTSDKAEEASVAYWRLIKSGILDKEYMDIEPLFVCVFSQAGLHTRRPVERVDDLGGLKIATGNPVVAEFVTRIKGVPISLALTEYYEAAQRGAVDGAITPWTAILPFKLHEVLRYHVDLPLGGNTGALFMAKKRFGDLSPTARKVILDNSGEAESRRFGAFWDSEQNRGRETVRALPGHTLATVPAEQQARLQELFQPIRQGWVARTPNGANILGSYEKLLTEARGS